MKHTGPCQQPRTLTLAVAAALTSLGLAMTWATPAHALNVTISQGQINNNGTSQNITIQSGVVVSGGGQQGIYNINATVATLLNSGSITGSTGIYNRSTITTLNNTIGALIQGSWYGIENDYSGSSIGTLSNSGTIQGNSYGIYNRSTIGALSNSGTVSGSITGIYNYSTGTIGTLTNSGHLSSLNNTGTIGTGVGSTAIANTGSIGVLSNGGSISGASIGVLNNGTIGTLSNSGSISGGDTNIVNQGVIGTLSNTGTIAGGGSAIFVGGSIGLLSNSGLIQGTGVGIDINGTITTLFNIGTISSGSQGGIDNYGVITTLTNGQHGLDYHNTLPINYNTYFASGSYTPSSTFATTVFTSPSGSITSYGIQLAASGVILATGIYHSVLSSSSTFNVGNVDQTLTYSLNGYSLTYKLVADSTNYDLDILCFGYNGSCGGSSGGGNGITPAVVAQHNNPAYYAARVIDANSTLSNLFSGVSGTAAQSAAASQSLPLVTGGATSVTQTALTSVNTIIDARQSANRGASSGDDFQTNRNMWLKAFGTEADQSDLDGVSGFKAHTGGVTFGADQKVNDKLTLGAAFAYANSNVSSTVGGASHGINIKGYQLIGYGSLALNNRDSVDFQLDGGMSNNSGSRDINFADVVANSSYNSWTAHLGSSLNRRYDLSDRLTLTPSLRVDYTRINESGYQESGAGDFDLNVNSQKAEALVFGVDGKLDYKLSDTLAVAANLGVGYDAMNKQDSIVAAYAGAPNASFITEGLNQGALISRAGVLLSYKLPKGMEISAHYDVEGRRNYLSQTASVKFSMPF